MLKVGWIFSQCACDRVVERSLYIMWESWVYRGLQATASTLWDRSAGVTGTTHRQALWRCLILSVRKSYYNAFSNHLIKNLEAKKVLTSGDSLSKSLQRKNIFAVIYFFLKKNAISYWFSKNTIIVWLWDREIKGSWVALHTN